MLRTKYTIVIMWFSGTFQTSSLCHIVVNEEILPQWANQQKPARNARQTCRAASWKSDRHSLRLPATTCHLFSSEEPPSRRRYWRCDSILVTGSHCPFFPSADHKITHGGAWGLPHQILSAPGWSKILINSNTSAFIFLSFAASCPAVYCSSLWLSTAPSSSIKIVLVTQRTIFVKKSLTKSVQSIVWHCSSMWGNGTFGAAIWWSRRQWCCHRGGDQKSNSKNHGIPWIHMQSDSR